jgi:hypothetical protein
LAVANGTFCVSAPIGKEVTITARSECGFAESVLTAAAPAADVRFARVKASVSGSGVCLVACSQSVLVRLRNSRFQYGANLGPDGRLVFSDVEFGQYNLSVEASPTEEWIAEVNNVVVRERVKNIGVAVRQVAFVNNVTISHEMTVKNGGKLLRLRRGFNPIRVTSPIIEPGDCHSFPPVDVRVQQRIIAEAVERSVEVKGGGAFEVFLDGEALEPPFTFSQRYGQKAVVVSVNASSPWYAEPPQLEVSPVASCNETVIAFEVVRGVEFSGFITPPIAGVAVIARAENTILGSTLTNESGAYSLGSYATNVQIAISASKTGYKLTRTPDTFNFVAEKLAEVSVSFERSSNSEDHGIILSLSRSDGFAQNVVVESANSTVIIPNIEAGDYFLKPVFREHQFDPVQLSFSLTQGETFTTTFSIRRVKFGISGVVRRITGEAEPDVEIEAVHANGDRQTAVTDAGGRFRISGLVPNQTVTLLARASATAAVDRVTPAQLRVKMGSDEYRGVRFLSMRLPRSFDILGKLRVDPDFLPKMNVVLLTPAGQVIERFSFPSKLSNLFYFINLTHEKYTVLVANTDRQLGESLVCPKHEVEFVQPHAAIEIACTVVATEQPAVGHVSSNWKASTIAFGCALVWIVFFNFRSVTDLVRGLLTWNSRPLKAKKQA